MSQRPIFPQKDSDFIEPEEDEDGCLLGISQDEDEWEKNNPSSGKIPSSQSIRNDLRVPKPFLRTRRGVLTVLGSLLLLAGTILVFFRNSIRIARLRQKGIPPGLYSRDGVLYVGERTPFMIKGFSWYGLEEPGHMPGGLGKVSIDEIFQFTREFDFNAIRLPLSVQNIIENPMGHTITFRNPELTGLSYVDVVNAVVQKAAENDVLILLDAHRLESDEIQSGGLWYSDQVSEKRLEYAWKILCDNLKDEWNVMGADAYNEPWDALWNSRNKSADWKTAAERLGNSIHESCPSWTIFVEGIGNREATTKTPVFWAENLRDIQGSPPELKLKSKVVLSPHVYGPSVYNQTYFTEDNFPDNMPEIWDDHFGEASKASGLATVIGEWGGHFDGLDKKWQSKFFEYLREKKIPFFYWSLNPDSVDTGGLIHDDWSTPETNRLTLLEDAPSTSVADHSLHFKKWRNWRV